MQELDKDHNPVNLEFTPCGSVVSIIESLHHEDLEPKNTTGPWTPTGDSLVTQSITLSRIGVEEGQCTSKEKVANGEKSESVVGEGVPADKPRNTEQSTAHVQCNSQEGNPLHLRSALSIIPLDIKFETLVTTPKNPRTNAHSHDHGEN